MTASSTCMIVVVTIAVDADAVTDVAIIIIIDAVFNAILCRLVSRRRRVTPIVHDKKLVL